MTEHDEFPQDEPMVRQQHFELDGPAELDVALAAGQVRVRLTDEPGVHVEVRADATPNPQWAQGLAGLMRWAGEQFGGGMRSGGRAGSGHWPGGFGPGGFGPGGFGPGFGRGGFGPVGFGPDGFGFGPFDRHQDEDDEEPGGGHPFDPARWAQGWADASSSDAVRQARIEQSGEQILVHSGAHGPLRMAPLLVVVRAPHGSQVRVQAGAADVSVSGAAGRVQVRSGAGDVSVEHAHEPSTTHTGSGDVRLGAMPTGVSARSGSGDVHVDSIGAGSSVSTNSGEVSIGTVAGDLTVRTASGELILRDAVRGRVQLVTGSGDIRVGVRAGVAASVDLSSRTGTASTELPFTDPPQPRSSQDAANQNAGDQNTADQNADSEQDNQDGSEQGDPHGRPTLYVRARTESGDAVVTAALATAG